MIERDFNHFRTVRESLGDEKALDEQVFSSLTVLSERLERLKKLDSAFADVAFSTAVEKLLRQENAVTV